MNNEMNQTNHTWIATTLILLILLLPLGHANTGLNWSESSTSNEERGLFDFFSVAISDWDSTWSAEGSNGLAQVTMRQKKIAESDEQRRIVSCELDRTTYNNDASKTLDLRDRPVLVAIEDPTFDSLDEINWYEEDIIYFDETEDDIAIDLGKLTVDKSRGTGLAVWQERLPWSPYPDWLELEDLSVYTDTITVEFIENKPGQTEVSSWYYACVDFIPDAHSEYTNPINPNEPYYDVAVAHGYYSNYQDLQESCTPDWQTGSWGDCEGGEQQRDVWDANSCGVWNQDRPDEYRSCDTSTSCTPDWDTTEWSSCDPETETQTRDVVDRNNCQDPSLSNKPAEERSCEVESCTAQWSCSGWKTCSNGTQTRSCVDFNNCPDGTATPEKPMTERSCDTTSGDDEENDVPSNTTGNQSDEDLDSTPSDESPTRVDDGTIVKENVTTVRDCPTGTYFDSELSVCIEPDEDNVFLQFWNWIKSFFTTTT